MNVLFLHRRRWMLPLVAIAAIAAISVTGGCAGARRTPRQGTAQRTANAPVEAPQERRLVLAPVDATPTIDAGTSIRDRPTELPAAPEEEGEESKLGKELEAAYAERRREGGVVSASSTAKMLKLRARAEKLADASDATTIGIAGDFVANVPNGLRIMTGDAGATVINPSNVPVGWFDISRSTGMCPPCGPNMKTIVAVPLSAKLVALLPQRYAFGGIIVNIETMRIVTPAKANLASIAVSHTRSQLAFVEQDYDDSVDQKCRGHLVVASEDGTVQRRPFFFPPKDFCQGQIDASWRPGTVVVSSEWSDELVFVDVAKGSATHALAPKGHTNAVNVQGHHSRVLCGPRRKQVKANASSCSVASRWVFPPDACAGAKSEPDERASTVCGPHFQGL